jgi:integrase
LLGRRCRDDAPSIFEGFTFHMLRHTAASLTVHAGMDAAALLNGWNTATAAR